MRISAVFSCFLVSTLAWGSWQSYKWDRLSASCKSGICFNKLTCSSETVKCFTVFLPSHSHLDPCSLGSHSVCMSQVFWRITKNTAVITCHLMCMGLMSIAKSTKIFLFSVQTLVILYLSITLRFLLFCLLLLQDSYSPFSIKKETQIQCYLAIQKGDIRRLLLQLLQSL